MVRSNASHYFWNFVFIRNRHLKSKKFLVRECTSQKPFANPSLKKSRNTPRSLSCCVVRPILLAPRQNVHSGTTRSVKQERQTRQTHRQRHTQQERHNTQRHAFVCMSFCFTHNKRNTQTNTEHNDKGCGKGLAGVRVPSVPQRACEAAVEPSSRTGFFSHFSRRKASCSITSRTSRKICLC